MTTPSRSESSVHLQYRNGTYYGQISQNYKRNGKGMLILDSSTVIFADWKHNQIQGMFIYLTDGIRAYGNMSNGKLDGYNIISSIPSLSQLSNNNNSPLKIRTFYGMFRNDKIYGRSVMVDHDALMVTQFNNNELEQILSKRNLRQRDLFQTLNDLFPNNLYTLDEYLTVFTKQFIKQIQNLDEISRYEPCINHFSKTTNQKFYGFQQINKPNKKFGILMIEEVLISIGEHNNNQLEGIGRLYQNQHVYDGAFRNGKIDGIGINFHIPTNKFILQVNDGQQHKMLKGFGFPLKQITQFRREFHLRSIYFYNDVAIVGVRNKFDNLITHIFQSNKRSYPQQHDQRPSGYLTSSNLRDSRNNSRSAKKIPSTTSPLRQKLSKYEMESDYIEDNSPIKNTYANQYRPAVDRPFRQDRGGDRGEFKRGRQQNNYNNNNRNDRHQNRFNSREQDRQSRHSRQELRPRNNSRFGNRSSIQQHNQQYNRNERFSQQKNNRYSQQNEGRLVNNYMNNNTNGGYERNSRTSSTLNYNNGNNRDDYSNSKSPQNNGQMMNRNRRHTKDLVKELDNQEQQRRLTLDEIYEKSGYAGRNFKR